MLFSEKTPWILYEIMFRYLNNTDGRTLSPFISGEVLKHSAVVAFDLSKDNRSKKKKELELNLTDLPSYPTGWCNIHSRVSVSGFCGPRIAQV